MLVFAFLDLGSGLQNLTADRSKKCEKQTGSIEVKLKKDATASRTNWFESLRGRTSSPAIEASKYRVSNLTTVHDVLRSNSIE